MKQVFGGGSNRPEEVPGLDAGLAPFFVGDHRQCDSLWAEVEAVAETTESLVPAFDRFRDAMLRHLRMEEEVIFPAFEEASGMMNGGPTFVMRSEHDQMRALLEEMSDAAQLGASEQILDLGDTLMMLIQQHNLKEEGMLYPMAERVLGPRWPGLSTALAAIGLDTLPGVDGSSV